ncbi:hypothetical protein AB0G15_05730 [Streptosporangium sp. NPDC023825]|uniref:hypothetical protein n=1 Tax=Streptosporangium sp. NPDC023825 TaxID=3154909 RepID=UPI0034354480
MTQLPEKYFESIVPAHAALLLNGWRVHTLMDEGRILLGSDRPEDIAERHSMGWGLELDCAEGLTDDARLVAREINGFINLDNFEWMKLVSATSIRAIVEFWGANIPRIKDTEWNRAGEICPNPICGGLCRKGHHYERDGVRECFMHLCRHYPMEKNNA